MCYIWVFLYEAWDTLCGHTQSWINLQNSSNAGKCECVCGRVHLYMCKWIVHHVVHCIRAIEHTVLFIYLFSFLFVSFVPQTQCCCHLSDFFASINEFGYEYDRKVQKTVELKISISTVTPQLVSDVNFECDKRHLTKQFAQSVITC